MSDVLAEILKTRTVTDGTQTFPLKDNMDEEEGRLITEIFGKVRPDASVEIGCAYGVSALYACSAMKSTGKSFHHTIVDPHQSTGWHGIGMRNLQRAGFGEHVTLVEAGSEIALPKMLAEGKRFQAAIIDGWHTFDHTLIDFFYVNKMLDVGGVVIIDDTRWPGIMPVVDHISTYPAYEYINQPNGASVRLPGKLRRLVKDRTLMPSLRREWDYPSSAAFRKVAEDTRNFDWHADF